MSHVQLSGRPEALKSHNLICSSFRISTEIPARWLKNSPTATKNLKIGIPSLPDNLNQKEIKYNNQAENYGSTMEYQEESSRKSTAGPTSKETTTAGSSLADNAIVPTTI